MASIKGFVGIDGPVETVPQDNPSTFLVEKITIALAGTPQQFTLATIPAGLKAVVQNDISNGFTDRIYVANSGPNTGTATTRIELRRGESVELKVADTSNIHIDSNNNGTVATLFVEQA